MTIDMRGYLSFLILWIVKSKKMTGTEIANEIARRKGSKPSPGTIYPALKDLKKKGLISSDKSKRYSLTKKGEKELVNGCRVFCQMFYDTDEMSKCC